MDCKAFREQIMHFQADEVAAELRERLQEHLNACPACARRLEVEDLLLESVRGGLPRETAPAGLASHIRAAIAAEVASGDTLDPGFEEGGDVVPIVVAWYRRPWLAAAAAVVLLALVVVPQFIDMAPRDPGTPVRVVEQAVLVVDADCERAGKTLDQQKGCRHPKHFNQLKLTNGGYWNVSLDGEVGREIVLAPDMRGQRLLVEGDLYPAIQTLRLQRFEVLESARRVPGLEQAPAAAVLVARRLP